MKISIIIPTWNQWQATLACLNSIKEHSHNAEALGCELEIIVVGCGANEATTKEFMPLGTALFGSNFKHLRLTGTTNFATACNQGVAYATAKGNDALFFLNCSAVLTEGWLEPLLNELNRPRVGAVAPLALYPDTRRVQHCGIAFTPTLQPHHIYTHFPANHASVLAKHELQALSGVAFMLRVQDFKQCGGYHQGYEGYQNSCENIELCCRLRDMGLTLSLVTESHVLYNEGARHKDHEATNANVLTKRCSGAFRPDMHSIALGDGHAVALTPWLGIYLTMPPEQDTALSQHHIESFDMAICWETLDREPLWQGGYQIMCALLEDADMYAQSTGLRLLQTAFFPAMPHYRLLAQTAAQAGNKDLARKASVELERLSAMLEDIDFLIHKARKLAEWGEQAQDPIIESLYTGWLTDLGLSVKE